jgi:hypothetical protein
MQNAEAAGKVTLSHPKATLKPPQCGTNATSKRHQSHHRAKTESRKQKCAQRHPGAKVEGRMQNAETAGKDI